MYYNDSIPRSFFGHGGVWTFTVTVHAVNHRPHFDIAVPALSVLRDKFARATAVFPAFASQISRGGPLNEMHQNLTFIVSNLVNVESVVSTGNATGTLRQIFAEGPSLDENGTLTFKTTESLYTESPAVFGVLLRDSGGTGHGGLDVSESVNFTIDILFVNYAPSFDLHSELVHFNYSSARYVQTVAGNISRGAELSSEEKQILSFQVVVSSSDPYLGVKHVEMFVNGTLSLIVEKGSWGDAVLDITLFDDGEIVLHFISTPSPLYLHSSPLYLHSIPALSPLYMCRVYMYSVYMCSAYMCSVYLRI